MTGPDPELNIWEHSAGLRELYARRAEGLEAEMDASAQAAELLAPFIRAAAAPPRLLDAGCGSGYLWHSFRRRGLAVEYHGLDYSPSLIEIGRRILPAHGVPAERLLCGRLEDLRGRRFEAAALINTLTFCPDFREPLERLAETGLKTLVIRDNFGDRTRISWEADGYLDPGWNHLKGYWNQWSRAEVTAFLAKRAFAVEAVEDERTRGRAESMVGKTYYWSWLRAVRK
ncbi:MAG: class I SAM-dependent methyltransferase [Deltaproteobacteria bacterium]|nr:class I SAM-dependent methyltransferase [Deltaproteobacteria bacterium]